MLERVDLDHDPVDLVVELDSLPLPLRAPGGDLLDGPEPLGVRVRAEAALAKPFQELPLALEPNAVAVARAVDPDRERPLGRDLGVLLAQRSGGRVSRVRSSLLALGHQPLVEGIEARERHVDLAADFEHRRRIVAPEAQGDRRDRAEVWCHVLALAPVASGRAAREHACLVHERDRGAVDLRLDDPGDLLRRDIEPLADVLRPLLQGLIGGHLLERAHRREVLGLLKLLGRWRSDTVRRRARVVELGVLGLQPLQLVVQPVVLGVRDLWVVEDVVAVEVVVELLAQLLDALGGVGTGAGRHGADRIGGGSRRNRVE